MDYLETGKKLAQDGNYEEALEKLSLALENDKENPDIHFFIGLCYSSLEEFSYAKYHYQIALSLNPDHPKTKLMWDGVKDVEAKKPQERSITRKAAANERRQQNQIEKDTQHNNSASMDNSADFQSNYSNDDAYQDHSSQQTERQYKVTDSKWEQAFPADELKVEESSSFMVKFLTFLVGFSVLGAIAFFVYKILQ